MSIIGWANLNDQVFLANTTGMRFVWRPTSSIRPWNEADIGGIQAYRLFGRHWSLGRHRCRSMASPIRSGLRFDSDVASRPAAATSRVRAEPGSRNYAGFP